MRETTLILEERHAPPYRGTGDRTFQQIIAAWLAGRLAAPRG